MPKIETRPLDKIRPDAGQARQSYDQDELRRLGKSLRERQLQPILIRPDGTIVAGHRRYFAALAEGLESLLVIVVEGELTTADVRGIQLTENIHRADLTPYEKWQACKELVELNGWQGKELAEHLHLDPSSVTRLLSPSKCIPEAVDALRDGKLGISDIYVISKQEENDQPGLLAMKLSGATRDALESHGRKRRAASTPAVRLARVKIAMPDDFSVILSGSDLGMSEVVELLSETLKEARRAAEIYDVKTFQNMMRDKAKAGA